MSTQKKKSVTKLAWKYKHRKNAPRKHIHNDWLECTEAEKIKIETQYKNLFIFEAQKAPKPTPSMEEFAKNKENKEK